MRDHIYSWTRLGGNLLQDKKKKIVMYVMYEIPHISNRILDIFWELPEYWRMTNKHEPFFLANDSTANIVISTEQNLNFLTSYNTNFFNGTFRSVLKLFTQLFIIHGYQNSTYEPLIFYLLPNKTKESYTKSFRHVLQASNRQGLIFTPTLVYVDSEVRIHQAVEKVLIYSEIRGCHFYLCQNWQQHIIIRLLDNFQNFPSASHFSTSTQLVWSRVFSKTRYLRTRTIGE